MINSFFIKMKNSLLSMANDNKGVGVVEVILILVVLIGLVVIFRDQLTTIMNGIFTRITNETTTL